MRVDVVTIFPQLFGPFLSTSLIGRGIESGLLQLGNRMRVPVMLFTIATPGQLAPAGKWQVGDDPVLERIFVKTPQTLLQ